ncbi:MAG: hypothetical protein Q4C22_06300 [Bacillota bacterium]|nr:hypothetical protein [Bacillota bacterium]
MLSFWISGLQIQLHVSLLLLILLLTLAGQGGLALLTVFFTILHECCHGAAARALGYTPERITAGLFGGVLFLKEAFRPPAADLLIHLAGPFFNLASAALFFRIYLEQRLPWLELLIQINLALGLFNLLPFYPLDGGKVTELYLLRFFGSGVANGISRFFSLSFALFLFFLGIYLVQYSIINLLLSALALNLYLSFRRESSFQYDSMRRAYHALEDWK